MKTRIQALALAALLAAAAAQAAPRDPRVTLKGTIVAFDSKSVFVRSGRTIYEIPRKRFAGVELRNGRKYDVHLRSSEFRQASRTPAAVARTRGRRK